MTCPICQAPRPPGTPVCPSCGAFPAPTLPLTAPGRAVAVAVGLVVLVLVTVAVLLVVMVSSLRGATEADLLTVADTVLTLASVLFFVGLLGYAAVVSAAALTAWWTYRAHRNLGRRSSSAWAAAGWLIPGVNLVLPLLVLKEIARGSERRLLFTWWASLLAAVGVLGVAALVGAGDPSAAAQEGNVSLVDAALPGLILVVSGLLLGALAGILFIVLVHRLSRPVRG